MHHSLFASARTGALLLAAAAITIAQTPAPASGVDLKNIDKSVDPCKDFFHYACGNWIKNNPIPPQYARWGTFNELHDRNLEILRSILDDSANHLDRSATDGKIGGFYKSCMNKSAIEKAGYTPIKPGLERIAEIEKKENLAAEVARLHNLGVSAFFRFGASPDADKSTVNLANIDQGGLGLPDKSYYLDRKIRNCAISTRRTSQRCCS